MAAAGIEVSASDAIGGWASTAFGDFGGTIVSGIAGDIANAAARTLINGADFGDNIIAALPNTIGQTIGNMQQAKSKILVQNQRAIYARTFFMPDLIMPWRATAALRVCRKSRMQAASVAPVMRAAPAVVKTAFTAIARFAGRGSVAAEAAAPRVLGPTGDIYSVAFETRLSPTSYPGSSRSAHFQEANEALLQAIEEDAAFAAICRALESTCSEHPLGWPHVLHLPIGLGAMLRIPA